MGPLLLISFLPVLHSHLLIIPQSCWVLNCQICVCVVCSSCTGWPPFFLQGIQTSFQSNSYTPARIHCLQTGIFLGCSSVTEPLPRMPQTLHPLSSTEKANTHLHHCIRHAVQALGCLVRHDTGYTLPQDHLKAEPNTLSDSKKVVFSSLLKWSYLGNSKLPGGRVLNI